MDGLVAGWHSLLDAVHDGGVGLGRAIPWVGALGVVAALVYAVVRSVRGRRTSRAVPVATPGPDETRGPDETPGPDRG